MSPVRELARSVTEEWPSASGGWPLGLLAGLLPLEEQTHIDQQDPQKLVSRERKTECLSPTSTCLAQENYLLQTSNWVQICVWDRCHFKGDCAFSRFLWEQPNQIGPKKKKRKNPQINNGCCNGGRLMCGVAFDGTWNLKCAYVRCGKDPFLQWESYRQQVNKNSIEKEKWTTKFVLGETNSVANHEFPGRTWTRHPHRKRHVEEATRHTNHTGQTCIATRRTLDI